MIRRRVLAPVAGAAALFLGCGDATGPGVTGRWAATGIELVALPQTAELRLACASPARLTHGLLPDSARTVRFSITVQPVWGTAYRVDFLGQLVGDSLYASLTYPGPPPIARTYNMVLDGDAGLDKIFCAQ